MIEIPKNITKRDYLLQVTYNMLTQDNGNYSEELLGEFMTPEKIIHEIGVMRENPEIRIPSEMQDSIREITEDEVKEYIHSQKREHYGYENNFTYIFNKNDDIFLNFLMKDRNTYNKTNCRELLIESIKIYKTKYNDELYIKIDETHFKHIGNCFEDIYQYYEKKYKKTEADLQRFIPFSSFFNPSKIKSRIFESLEPNRHIIMFDDCILDIAKAKTIPLEDMTIDTIPFSVVDGAYQPKNEECYSFVTNLFNKLVEEPDVLRSIMYSLLNKDELIKSAIFNIQKSGKGKTKLLDPFKMIGILITADSDTLERPLEREVLFKQRLIVNFEEIQDANIQGSKFNSLIDDSAITVPRKNRTAIDVPAYIKPAIIINGEDLPDFRGRTRGTLNRFSMMPLFVNEITPDDAEFIKANGFLIGIEMIRYLMQFKLNTTMEQRRECLMTCKITEQQYIKLRESKTKTIFEYVDEAPQTPFLKETYCISEKILEDMIIQLQDLNILTVHLFNNDSSIKKFIRNGIIKELDIEDGGNDGYMNQSIRTGVKQHGKRKTHVIKYCLQLTDKGKEFVTSIGYDLSDLRVVYNKENV